MKKRIWLTMLENDEQTAQRLYQTITRYGLDADGHFWVDDLENMAWSGPMQSLSEPATAMWLISAQGEGLSRLETRYGLSLLALAVQGRRALPLPILLLVPEEKDQPALPTPLAGAEVLNQEAGLGPKLAARANMPPPEQNTEYRFTVHPLPGLGQWLEVGPARAQVWAGSLLGLDQGRITAHGVGPAGKVPERTVLEYQMQDMTLEAGGEEFTAWAVHNRLTDAESYYVQIKGMPGSLLFGGLPDGDSGELYRLQLV
ncbi:MAG: hypothetical protein ACLFRE_02610 [Desulfovermiculus sp.]